MRKIEILPTLFQIQKRIVSFCGNYMRKYGIRILDLKTRNFWVCIKNYRPEIFGLAGF